MTAVRSSISRGGWWLTVLVLVALAPAVASGAGKVSTSPVISSEISVTLVEMPVEVVRNGDPVAGLRAADFEVVEGNHSLPIVAFEPLGADRPEKPGAPPPSLGSRRHLFFLFDFAFSRPKKLEYGVAAALDLVSTRLDPHDLVAVGIYLPKGELQLLLSFTTDREAATRTLAALQSLLNGDTPAAGSEELDPLRLTGLGARSLLSQVFRVDERNAAAEAIASLGPSDGTVGSFLQHNVLAHSAVVQQPEVEARIRGHVMAMSDAMDGLAETLRPVAGRKYLALFSEGFPLSVAEAYGSVHTPSGGGALMLDSLRKTVEELRRSGWILHAVNLAGARSGLNADGLFFLAKETGGELVEGTNKFGDGLDGALRRSSQGYLLTVEIDGVPLDGAYHKVDVRLREPRRAKVVHRGGYFAPLPFSQQKNVQRLAEAATLVAGEDERDDLGVQVVAVPLRAGAESTPVAVLVEVPGAPLLASGAPRVGLEVYGYALDAQGNSKDFFAEAVDLDRAKVGTRLAQGGVRVLGKLELPMGQHRLRVLVRDRGNGRLSLLTVPLSLAAAAAGAAARVDALFLPAPDDPWLLIRPAQAAFDVHGRLVLPAAHGAVPSGGEVQVLLVGQGFTGKGAWMKTRILTAEGKAIEGGSLEFLTVTAGDGGEPDLVVGRLRAGTLPAGRYLLELRIEEDSVARAATARFFDVTPAPGGS